MKRKKLPRILLALFLSLLVLLVRPATYLLYTWLNDKNELTATPPGYVNDASRLDQTPVDSILRVPSDPAEAERQLQSIVRYAIAHGKKISIGGAQHSMGGHTITRDGIYIDMRGFNRMQLDTNSNVLTVGSGAMWLDIIPYLDSNGRSVLVMQSNNSFSVGGSISVNCHGWQMNYPPIASTVLGLRLLTAGDSIIHCSRSEHPELFSLALGGYGLFGIILDVELHVTQNRCYKGERWILPSENYAERFREETKEYTDGMAYGRLDIRPDHFLDEAILTVFRDQHLPPPTLQPTGLTTIKREVFRGSVNSDFGKDFRWDAEKSIGEFLSSDYFSRNQLLNESADIYANTSASSTDILHEYFIPKDHAAAFIQELKKIIPQHHADLLNVTIRNVKPDTTSFLCYAREEMFGFVMLFNQPMGAGEEEKMQALTRDLVDAALRQDGTYYLPYRLHATREQFRKAYPQAEKFFSLKKKYDPQEIFSNRFYEQYR